MFANELDFKQFLTSFQSSEFAGYAGNMQTTFKINLRKIVFAFVNFNFLIKHKLALLNVKRLKISFNPNSKRIKFNICWVGKCVIIKVEIAINFKIYLK